MYSFLLDFLFIKNSKIEKNKPIFVTISFKIIISFWFFSMKITLALIWGILYFCTMDRFFRILKKGLSELICTRLYYYVEFSFTFFDKIVDKSDMTDNYQPVSNVKLAWSRRIFSICSHPEKKCAKLQNVVIVLRSGLVHI